MSRREKEKAKSLDKLAKFAYGSASAPPPAPKPAPAPPARIAAPRRPPPSSPLPSPSSASPTEARRKQLAQRQAKLEEERALKARRANELARGARIDMSRIDPFNVPASIRRTGFDRHEPSVSQKIQDVLGEAKAKEGRAKARDKGKRQK